MDKLQLGNLAEWAAAIGTVLAVSLALFQIGTERRARLARDRRSQVVHVSAWPVDI